jgi:hypothetical protein
VDSIYGKESYSQSKCVFLAGPIEWWWGERFETPEAKMYRAWRESLCLGLVNADYLVYRPWDAFKGPWNEKFQGVNDFVLVKSDLVIEMTPRDVIAHGTAHELELALSKEIPTLYSPPPDFAEFELHVENTVKAVDKALAGVLH